MTLNPILLDSGTLVSAGKGWLDQQEGTPSSVIVTCMQNSSIPNRWGRTSPC